MPRKRFTNEQIAFALRQAENGATQSSIFGQQNCPASRRFATRTTPLPSLCDADYDCHLTTIEMAGST